MEQLWAPWRLAYVQEAGAAEGCVFCREAAGELGDASLVVHRGERAFVLLNKFPYASGHLMVAPVGTSRRSAISRSDESAEIHALTVQAIAALRRPTRPRDSTSAGTSARWRADRSRATCTSTSCRAGAATRTSCPCSPTSRCCPSTSSRPARG